MSARLWGQRLPVRLLIQGSPKVSHHEGIGTSAARDTIHIPARIHRSPTDILKAMAATVGRDAAGPHYKYSDDPYLTPASNMNKRSYALSKESGRKAARWIREQNPQLFTHRPDDPLVERFQPNVVYSEAAAEGVEGGEGGGAVNVVTVVGRETLAAVVARGEVTNAITVYNMCKAKGTELGDELLQGLLELLCFYNAEEQVEEEWVEERWYRQTSTTTRKTWKDNGVAEDVFAALTQRGPPAYCALICGMARYYQVDRAWQLYQECQERAVPLDTATHNALVRVASFMRDAPDLRWLLVKEVLSAMGESGTQPDLGTLNATLEALSQVGGWRQARDISLQVLAEFRGQDIRPSLASYYHLLAIHCRDRGPKSDILHDILDHLEGQSFTAQDAKDFHFFVTAMEVARNHLRSLGAAQRVDALLRHADNHILIGDSYKESVYHRHYFALSCATLPMEEFMQVYEELVPHIYTPEPGIMQEVIQAVHVSGALHYLPKMWSDMVTLDHASRDRLVAAVVSALAQHRPGPGEEGPGGLTERLATLAKDIWNRVQGQDPERRNRVTWMGQMLGEVLEVFVRCGEYRTAQEVLGEASTSPQAILGYLPPHALATLLDAAVERQDTDTAVAVVQYSHDSGHQEAGQMAQQVCSGLALTPHHRATLSSLLGGDTLLTPHPPSPATPTPGE